MVDNSAADSTDTTSAPRSNIVASQGSSRADLSSGLARNTSDGAAHRAFRVDRIVGLPICHKAFVCRNPAPQDRKNVVTGQVRLLCLLQTTVQIFLDNGI
jgi:hypothetical protein